MLARKTGKQKILVRAGANGAGAGLARSESSILETRGYEMKDCVTR
jgi:hypothetical protein